MKKKTITLFYATLLTGIFWSNTAFASEIDLTGLSLEQLIDLRTEINELIAEKGGENVIGSGAFEVGVDIKPGIYNIVCTANATGGVLTIGVYETKTDHDNFKGDLYQSIYKEEGTPAISLNLKEGNVIGITGEGIIQETSPSWAMD